MLKTLETISSAVAASRVSTKQADPDFSRASTSKVRAWLRTSP